MIRTFEFTIEDPTYGDNATAESIITIDDSESGLYWKIDGHQYRLSSQNIRDLKEILDQVELPE